MSKQPKYTEGHYEFCQTDKQRRFLKLVLNGHNMPSIAGIMEIDLRNVFRMGERILKAAKRYNYHPDASMPTPAEITPVSGTSTLYKRDPATGEATTALQWVKTNVTAEQMISDARELIRGMHEDIPRAEPVKMLSNRPESSPKLLNLHILTDYHLGMYAWGEETHGDNWNTEIAEDFLIRWFEKAISNAPAAKTGFLMQLGDFLHFDGLHPVTPASGHVLDGDTRFRNIQRVAIRSLRRIITMMLSKYENVVILMVEGNHDESSAGWLTEIFASFLSDEPRVTVITDPAPFGAYEFGNVMLGWTHGHKVRPAQLDKAIVGRFPEMFGATKYRYAHVGHFHHRELKKDLQQEQLMSVEMHTTIAAMDSYSANHGYGGARGADVITYHSEYGQVGRSTLTPEMVLA